MANKKHPQLTKGDLIGTKNVLEVIVPIERDPKTHSRYYRTKCIICGQIQRSVYGSNKKGCRRRCHRNIDLLKAEFKNYRVLDYFGSIKGHTTFNCICICGNHFLRAASEIRRGIRKGCGCLQTKVEHPSKQKPDTLHKSLLRRYSRDARTRNFKFALSLAKFKELTQQPCFYCNALPNQKHTNTGCLGQIVYNGIDRLDNKKGYTSANCVPCCKQCNWAKRDLSYTEFINWVQKIRHK
jgi:hypothetical protein